MARRMAAGNRRFESISLQRRVNKLPVPLDEGRDRPSPKGTARAEKALTNQTTCRCGQWGVSVMTEEEARLHAEGIAHGMGITVYVIRSREGDYLLAQTPSDDCEIISTATPPAHKSAFDRE